MAGFDLVVKEYGEKIKQLPDIPRFIAFEGVEGSGKTTQARMLAKFLRKLGFQAEIVKDPGTTELGEKIRRILKSDVKISPISELFLFLSARRQLVDEVIRPSMRQGKVIITDRFTPSTLAYQGRGRGLIPETLPMLCYIATGGVEPEITFVLDIDPEIGLARVKKRYEAKKSRVKSEEEEGQDNNKSGSDNDDEEEEKKKDRFERQDIDFHRRIREYYIEFSESEENVFLIDADRPPDEVFQSVVLNLYRFAEEKYSGKW